MAHPPALPSGFFRQDSGHHLSGHGIERTYSSTLMISHRDGDVETEAAAGEEGKMPGSAVGTGHLRRVRDEISP